MKIRRRPNRPDTAWLASPRGSAAYRRWLADPGSLTRRLQRACRQFSVEGVRQQAGRPELDEARLLGLRVRELALLREVTLCCDGRPVVFAHSVLPRRSLSGPWQAFRTLGNRPLGAALFANPCVTRTPLSFRKLRPGQPLYQRAAAGLQGKPACLWARRSLFMLKGAAILVTEVFLPGIRDR